VESKYFCFFGAHVKFNNPTITPSGRKVTQAQRRQSGKTSKYVKLHHCLTTQLKMIKLSHLNPRNRPGGGVENTPLLTLFKKPLLFTKPL
jgi:hypothetical protein